MEFVSDDVTLAVKKWISHLDEMEARKKEAREKEFRERQALARQPLVRVPPAPTAPSESSALPATPKGLRALGSRIMSAVWPSPSRSSPQQMMQHPSTIVKQQQNVLPSPQGSSWYQQQNGPPYQQPHGFTHQTQVPHVTTFLGLDLPFAQSSRGPSRQEEMPTFQGPRQEETPIQSTHQEETPTFQGPRQEETPIQSTHQEETPTSRRRLRAFRVELCTICREVCLPDHDNRKTPCRHIFHKDCIEEWFNEHGMQCPNCPEQVHTLTPYRGQMGGRTTPESRARSASSKRSREDGDKEEENGQRKRRA